MANRLPRARVEKPDRILIVDDDAATREWLADVLTGAGYDPVPATDGAEALIHLWAQSFSVILLDQNLPGLCGLELLPSIRTACPKTAVIVITGDDAGVLYREALEKGVFDLLVKPISVDLLIRTVRSSVHFARCLGVRSPLPSPSAAVALPAGGAPGVHPDSLQ